MSSHAEFRRSYRRYCFRYIARMGTVFALGALVFLVIWLILEVADQRDNATVRAEAAMSVAIVVALAAVVLSARYAEREAREDSILTCPQCDSPLSYYYGVIVLSCGNCPHCGQPVLDD
jgi:hypothetical protein